jgi:glucose-1-phosphate cytidylyltransferase
MKVVIFAGGFGTRFSEETEFRPKPMIEIGEKPILWHIMKIYSHYSFNEFIICSGYKSYFIKDYFYHYYMHTADISVDLSNNNLTYHNSSSEPWKVTVVDTGLETMTGARLKKVQKYIGNEPFMLTYGDGLANINLNDLLKCHQDSKKIATVTAVQPKGKFASLKLSQNNAISSFNEKVGGDGSWFNGGFFVLQPEVFNYIKDCSQTIFEREPLENLAKDGELQAFKHSDFWMAMDTLREKLEMQKLWETGSAPWKIWNG